MNDQELESLQTSMCRKYGQLCLTPAPDTKVGFALETQGKVPINGFRHPAKGDANGWYIWCGETLSNAADFFSPLHTIHLRERCPEILQFLGLPPGWRFLLAGDHVDVWYDSTLLNVNE
jgi:hypothetical protein